MKITLRDYYAATKPQNNQILLKSGTICALNEEYCIDTDGSESYWSAISSDICGFNECSLRRTSGKINLCYADRRFYIVIIKDVTFAITRMSVFALYRYTLTPTEHPKLVIMEISLGRTFKSRYETSVKNLDIFPYVNSKFIYIERHIKAQLITLYGHKSKMYFGIKCTKKRNLASIHSSRRNGLHRNKETRLYGNFSSRSNSPN